MKRLRAASFARQRGLTLPGLLVVAGLLVAGAIVAVQVVPGVMEFRAARTALQRAATEGGPTAQGIRNAFDRQAAIDDIVSVAGKDLELKPLPGGGYTAAFRYEKRIRLFGPASLLLDFQARSDER